MTMKPTMIVRELILAADRLRELPRGGPCDGTPPYAVAILPDGDHDRYALLYDLGAGGIHAQVAANDSFRLASDREQALYRACCVMAIA